MERRAPFRFRRLALAVATLLASGMQVAAQPPATADREALFEAMRAAPEDLDLMFRHAALSMAEGDAEAAVATLERMLVFNPDLPRVKLELGAAYHRLGAYEVARMHFEDVLAGDPPDEVRATVESFLAEIDRRTATSRVSGFVSIGVGWTSNANLGPPDLEVLVADFPGGVGLLPPGAAPEPSFGVGLGAGFTHSADLGRPTEDAWITSGIYAGQRHFSASAGEFDAVELTSGPRLSLDGRQFGAALRPFALGGFVRSADRPLYVQGGLGAELTVPIDPRLGLFAGASGAWREFSRLEDFEGLHLRAQVGLARVAGPDTVLRVGVFGVADRARRDWTSSAEFGLRGSLAHQFRGLSSDLPAGPLSAALQAQVSGRWFDGPDPAVSPRTRDDLDLRIGARLHLPLTERVGVAAEAGWFHRESNLPNYRLDSFDAGVSLVLDF